VVAALVDGGPAGRWAAGLVAGGGLYAPRLLPVEVAHTLRRAAHLGRIGAESAGLAHAELARLDVELIP
jgi:predicted nucleic acid-binding protein